MTNPKLPEGIKSIKDYPKATSEEQVQRMAFFRKIVEEKQHQPIQWIGRDGKRRSKMVDFFTASVVCAVYDELSDENKAAFCSLEPIGMINLAYCCSFFCACHIVLFAERAKEETEWLAEENE